MRLPEISDVREASVLIDNYIHRTPVMKSQVINRFVGANMFFKCENFQKVGAFKFRGASYAVAKLDNKIKKKGVATHSSGNHAAALALAAKIHDIPAYIVMPENAPRVKREAVYGYGAKIYFCEPTLEAREQTLKSIVNKTGATFIHPYDNVQVIAGQGTVAMEFLEQMPHPDVIMAPVGGGGLLSGTAITVSAFSPDTKIIGAEPQNADDAFRSFHAGTLIPSVNPHTVADGLLTSLSERTFTIIRQKVSDVLTAREENIISAMRLIWERMKIIVEPSAALPLAVVIENPDVFEDKTIGIILSGGNVDLDNLPF